MVSRAGINCGQGPGARPGLPMPTLLHGVLLLQRRLDLLHLLRQEIDLPLEEIPGIVSRLQKGRGCEIPTSRHVTWQTLGYPGSQVLSVNPASVQAVGLGDPGIPQTWILPGTWPVTCEAAGLCTEMGWGGIKQSFLGRYDPLPARSPSHLLYVVASPHVDEDVVDI